MNRPSSETEPTDRQIAALLADIVPGSIESSEITGRTRAQFSDLLHAPPGPIDRSAYAWADVGPGLKLHLVSEDPGRGVRRCLVWGAPGAKTPRHGHSGDEVILVLEGSLEDDRGVYGPGEICRSTAADIHQEQVVGDVDCVCFVLYYGELIPV